MTIQFGDLDDVDLILDIEQSFGISIPQQEASECQTFGDLFDCVAGHVHNDARGACLSARTFRRLRDALEPVPASGARLRPTTRISDLAPGMRWRRWRRSLEKKSGLAISHLPTEAYSLAMGGWWMALFVCAAFEYVVAPSFSFLRAFVALPIVAAVLPLVFRRPHRELTIGDLVRIAAPHNAGKLTAPGRPIRTADLWTSLEAMTRFHGACEGPIDRRTRFEHR